MGIALEGLIQPGALQRDCRVAVLHQKCALGQLMEQAFMEQQPVALRRVTCFSRLSLKLGLAFNGKTE